MIRTAKSLTAMGLILFVAGAASTQEEPPPPEESPPEEEPLPTKIAGRRSGTYIVRMSEDPVVTYQGGVPGLRATKPGKGKKIDPNDPAVVSYGAYLDSKHDRALAAVGGGRKLYDYRYALNGFAAQLTSDQAAKLAATEGVVAVEPDLGVPLDTLTTPRFLGLTAAGGLWDQLGGFESAGEDVIIGDIDTGVWPEHPSLSDRTGTNPNGGEGKLDYHQIPGWHGKCVPGQDFNASHCNQKLIGCQFYVAGFGAENLDPTEFLSCRDSDGHGTHTATTAAGNHGVSAVIDGIVLGEASGIAPRARIAAYKTCWRAPGKAALCFGSDRAAAIDQAVADGVDVLNHSVNSTQTNFLDQVQMAFLSAAQAGVFVATSGGDLPAAATVGGPAPWITTVGATTHDRSFGGTVELGSGVTFSGASLTAGTAMLPLVHASSVGVATDPTPTNPTPFATRIAFCFPGHLDPAKAAGKIVMCDRGFSSNAARDKSLAVKQADGAGMVLRNIAPLTGVTADLHHVPTVHVESAAGTAIKAYIDSNSDNATAKLTGNIPGTVPAPFIGPFSRGPILATGGDILKPDLTAPGVDILAGVSPAGDGGRAFDFRSGTSMSSPHVAGLAALLKQSHQDWSPMMIKSALMTTATRTLGATNPFLEGAGQVKPNAAVDPGLVYDHGFSDWMAFICGTGQLTGCSSTIDPSDLNQASIAIGDLAGVQTVTRTVTNVGARATYTVTVTAPPGIGVVVNPTTLTLSTGESASYSVRFTRTTAGFETFPSGFQFGSLTWSDGAGHTVRSPLAIRPVILTVPAQVSGTGASGSVSFQAKYGYSGPFLTTVSRLVAAMTQVGHVVDDPDDRFNTLTPTANKGFTTHTLVIRGCGLCRIALFDDQTDGNDDLDLYVYGPMPGGSVGLVGSSRGPTSTEEVNLNNPIPGTYTVFVHGLNTDGPDANYTLFSWIGGPPTGNLTVTAPSPVTAGGTGTITASWSGLSPATKYLGLLTFRSTPFTFVPELGHTLVRVDTP